LLLGVSDVHNVNDGGSLGRKTAKYGKMTSVISSTRTVQCVGFCVLYWYCLAKKRKERKVRKERKERIRNKKRRRCLVIGAALDSIM
jgi:hypothetical protein